MARRGFPPSGSAGNLLKVIALELADERLFAVHAERGYDVEDLSAVRLDPELKRAAEARAEADHTTLSEVIRQAPCRFLEVVDGLEQDLGWLHPSRTRHHCTAQQRGWSTKVGQLGSQSKSRIADDACSTSGRVSWRRCICRHETRVVPRPHSVCWSGRRRSRAPQR